MRFLIILLLILSSGSVFSGTKKEQTSRPKTEKQEKEQQKSKVVVNKKIFNKTAMERLILHYEQMIKDYKTEIQSLLKRTVAERKRQVEQKYMPSIKKEEKIEAQGRKDAIVLFKEFIKKYPNNPKYSPSAMYRLAELYYERAMLVQDKKMQKYEKLSKQYEDGILKKEPEIPVVDFSQSINLYREVINRFPNFKYIGIAYYMLGYCLNESDRSDEAIVVWEDILKKHIQMPYLDEIYLRIGDYYFNNSKLSKALFYFKKGLKFKGSRFYDKILYKLAWTYYRQNNFQEAVNTFVTLINFADKMKKEGKDRGQDLRKEAVQYIAICFSDEDWGSIQKAISYFKSIKGASFEKDVFEKLGKYYYENSNYKEAEEAYKFVLKRHPYYENAPRIHFKLIQLYNRMREFDKAFKETEKFAQIYSRDSAWALRNRGNATVVQYAANLAKKSLLQTATYHHRQAQIFKEKGEFAKAKSEYIVASKFYAEYLQKFPYTSESYEISFDYADALYFGGFINKAVVVYERIRDDKNQNKYKADAALQTFVCYNQIWENSEESKIPGKEKRGKPFSPLEKKLIQASDIYLSTAKVVTNKAAVAYTVARIFFDHGKFDEAKERYLKIINEFPDSKAALYSARDIIGSFTEKKDWVNVAKWSKILTDRLKKQTSSSSSSVASEFKTYRAGALFMYAQKLEEEKKYKEAAKEYLRLVEENPYNKNADKALYNAAVNYQRALMFDSALKLHERIYKEYPYSSLAPESLYLVAYNAERSYNFEKAVQSYKLLYKKYPNFDKRDDAIYNAGFLLERLKKYKEAAIYYKLYYEAKSNEKDGKEALYLSGNMYQKAHDWKRMIRAYDYFINKFKRDGSVANLVMRCYHQIAKVYDDKLNKWNKAKKYYKKMVDFVAQNNLTDYESLSYAAEGGFKLLEDEFETYISAKIGGKNEKKLAESLKRKVELKNELEKKYKEILKYKVYDWTIASIFRIGFLYQSFSDSLFNVQPPKGLTPDEEDIYMQMLQEKAEPIEQKAVDIYTDALAKARKMKVFNKWTQLITEKLSVLRPSEYKVGKKPMFAENSSLRTGYPVVLTLDKKEKKKYKKAGIGESEISQNKNKKKLKKKQPSSGEVKSEKNK